MSKFVPKYSLWEAINASLSLGMRALEEIRTLARQPGPAGKDGLSLDKDFDFDVEFDGARTFTLKWTRQGEKVTRSFVTRTVLDAGIFKEGQSYRAGDGVSFGGSWFIAQEDTTEKPETGKGWRLAVKRGRDGRDGTAKEPRPVGPVKVG